MSDNLQKFTRAAHTLRSVAVRMPEGGWDTASCCDGWTAREVAGHAAWVLQNITATSGHGEPPPKRSELEVAGDDPTATVCRSVDECLAALDQPGTLHTVAPTPFGEMEIDTFIGTIWLDPLTHAWDIADAAGIDAGIDDATATEAMSNFAPIAEMVRGAGVFGPQVAPHGSGAVAEFVAIVGRTPTH